MLLKILQMPIMLFVFRASSIMQGTEEKEAKDVGDDIRKEKTP